MVCSLCDVDVHVLFDEINDLIMTYCNVSVSNENESLTVRYFTVGLVVLCHDSVCCCAKIWHCSRLGLWFYRQRIQVEQSEVVAAHHSLKRQHDQILAQTTQRISSAVREQGDLKLKASWCTSIGGRFAGCLLLVSLYWFMHLLIRDVASLQQVT